MQMMGSKQHEHYTPYKGILKVFVALISKENKKYEHLKILDEINARIVTRR